MAKSRRSVCLLTTIAVIIALGLLFLILGLTVFKPKHPATTVDSVSLADLDFSVDVFKLRVYFNVSVDTDLTVKNPNRVGFKYSASNAFLRYRGNDVGQVPFPTGEIRARETTGFNLTLTLMADRLLSDSDFYSDVVSGVLNFQTFIRLSGYNISGRHVTQSCRKLFRSISRKRRFSCRRRWSPKVNKFTLTSKN